MHNSWYFRKSDNRIENKNKALKIQAQFIKALLCSKRKGTKNKLKDYGRAYFNKSILKRFAGEETDYRPLCGAGRDFFFIDPYGNISPCNGSQEEWIIGNIKVDSFEEIIKSAKAEEIMKTIACCKRNCCFIVTDRHVMLRRPWEPAFWVLNNKIRLFLNIPVKFYRLCNYN